STNILKFADDTAVVGLISNNDETAYLEEIKNLETWCQDYNLLLNVSKTKELIVDFSTNFKTSQQDQTQASQTLTTIGLVEDGPASQ
ncbi:hypothetical protein QTP70_011413, partial [Hemibagrus guttatus]